MDNVPVIDVVKDNFSDVWPTLIHAITNSTFTALDLELSGLGNRKAITAKCVDERYKAIGDAAKSRSIVSLGLSCYCYAPAEETAMATDSQEVTPNYTDVDRSLQWTYKVQTFNLTLLCMQDYVVEPRALQFLVQHDFDFNKQYAQGIPYSRGNDKPEDLKCTMPSIRRLLLEILRSKKSVVLHNGLVDLIFLYHNFYAELPTKFQGFLADIREMFAGGVFDTKYISEFKLRHKASFLEYVFRKMQRLNVARKANRKSHLQLNFPSYGSLMSCVEYKDLGYTTGQNVSKDALCENFSNYGWCSKNSCNKLHDVNAVLDIEEAVVTKKKRRRRRIEEKESKTNGERAISESQISPMESDDVNEFNCAPVERLQDNATDSSAQLSHEIHAQPAIHTINATSQKRANSTHRASCDAFMTGFIMAVHLTSLALSPRTQFLPIHHEAVASLANHIFLSGKDQPLVIEKSNFASTTKAHKEKML